MGLPVKLGSIAVAGGTGVTFPASLKGSWTRIHADLETAADTVALANPTAYSNSNAFPFEIGPGTRVRIVARFLTAATVTTSPVVRFYVADQRPTSAGVFPSGTIWQRIDSDTFNTPGTTITLSTAAGVFDDGTYKYSEVFPNTAGAGYDLMGGTCGLALIETAANVNTGAVELFACLLN